MKIRNEKAWATFPNVAFAFNTEYHLTPEELYVYTNLHFLNPNALVDAVASTVDNLVWTIGWQEARASKPRAKVIAALTGLQDKGYIEIECEGSMDKGFLHISLNKEMEKAEVETTVDYKTNPYVWKGFTVITAAQFNLIESAEEFMVLAYTIWRDNPNFDYRICFNEWAGVLGCSRRNAIRILDKCERFLTKTVGKTIISDGKTTQEANIYKVATPEKEAETVPIVEEVSADPAPAAEVPTAEIPVKLTLVKPTPKVIQEKEKVNDAIADFDDLLKELI